MPGIAPLVGSRVDLAGILRRSAALAAALGADPQALAQAAQKRELTAAEDALRAATELKTSPVWRTLTAGTGVAAWNPEIPCGPRRPCLRLPGRGRSGQRLGIGLGVDGPGSRWRPVVQ